MPLNPKLIEFVRKQHEGLSLSELPIEEVRRHYQTLCNAAQGKVDVASCEKASRGLIYRSPSSDRLIIYIHGGGFVAGSASDYDKFCRRLTVATGCNVFSVNYRLAPEHLCPAAHDDVIEALEWAFQNIPAQKVFVAGDSAGGNLAAYAAFKLRDRLSGQILINPAIDSSCSYPSMDLPQSEVVTVRREAEWFYKTYRQMRDYSPIFFEDLRNLPPTLMIISECDILRDEEKAYAAKLEEAGNHVVTSFYPGMIHGFMMMPDLLNEADLALEETACLLRSW